MYLTLFIPRDFRAISIQSDPESRLCISLNLQAMFGRHLGGNDMSAKSIALTTIILLGASGSASAFCSQPSAPSCASGYGSFDDEWEFDSCKRDMETYRSEVESFTLCHQREVDAANEEAEDKAREARDAASEAESTASSARIEVDRATSDYNDAVRSFNSRAGG